MLYTYLVDLLGVYSLSNIGKIGVYYKQAQLDAMLLGKQTTYSNNLNITKNKALSLHSERSRELIRSPGSGNEVYRPNITSSPTNPTYTAIAGPSRASTNAVVAIPSGGPAQPIQPNFTLAGPCNQLRARVAGGLIQQTGDVELARIYRQPGEPPTLNITRFASLPLE